jgi:large subunit ribosomal protein L25
MEYFALSAKNRRLAGTPIAKKLRRAGFIPAVLYGPKMETQSIAVDPKAVRRAFIGPFGRNQIFTLEVPGLEGTATAIAREIQVHPVKRTLEHVDFYALQPGQTVDVKIPVRTSGRSEGEKVGGQLDIIRRDILVRCLPEHVPASVDLDVTPFPLNTQIMVDQLPYPDGVRPLYKKPYLVLEIVTPKRVEEVAAAGAAEGAEGEEKEEGEGKEEEDKE